MTITKDNIRQFGIQGANSSLSDRRKVLDIIRSLGEKIYEGTGFKSNTSYTKLDCGFYFSTSGNDWQYSVTPSNITLISATQFLESFQAEQTTSTHKYSPGDTVKILDSLHFGDDYSIHVNHTMAKLTGKSVILTKLTPRKSRLRGNLWKIADDVGDYDWSEDMFEPISVTSTPQEETIELEPKQQLIKFIDDAGLLDKVIHNIKTHPIGKRGCFHEQFFWRPTTESKDFWENFNESIPTPLRRLPFELSDVENYRLNNPTSTPSAPTEPFRWEVGQLFTYKKTGTIYKIKNRTQNRHGLHLYTLVASSNGKSASWCTELDTVQVLELFTESTTTPYVEPIPTPAPKVGDTWRRNVMHDGGLYHKGELVVVTRIYDSLGKTQVSYSGERGLPLDRFLETFSYVGLAPGSIQPPQSPVGTHISCVQSVSIKAAASSVGSITTCGIMSPTTEAISIHPLCPEISPLVLASALNNQNQTQIKIPKDKKMARKSIKETAGELVQDNKTALVNAAEIKAGQIINKQIITLVKPKLPMMVRGYADSPIFAAVLANAVGFGLKQYAPENPKLQKLSTLMLNAAAFDSIDALNIDEMIDTLLASIKLPAGVSLDSEE